MLDLDTIICPVELQQPANPAAEVASGLASQSSAELVLLHVVEASPTPLFTGQLSPPPAARPQPAHVHQLRQQLSRARQALEAVCQQHRRPDRPVRAEVRAGSPAETIVEFAETCAADLIVMGTRGRTGLGRLLHGSVAEEVVRTAPCPVLTVRRDEPSPAGSSHLTRT